MEEILIANLTLDTYRKNNIPPLIVPQGDYGARAIHVKITEQGTPVNVESTAAVSIVATRSGDGESQAFSGKVNTDGSVTVPVTQWMLDVPEDDVTCHVVVTGSGYQYSTTSFLIEPQAKANPTEISADDPRVDVVTEVLANENARQSAETTRETNEQARKTAEDARQSAETQRLTDEATRVANEAERVSAESSRDATFKGWAQDIASLPSFDARISANADRITNLEAGIPSSLWAVDDTAARVKDVPENARPKAIINKIGGMSYKTENLWDEQWEVGRLDTSTGDKANDSTRIRTKNYISVFPQKEYFINAVYDAVVFFYTADKTFLSYKGVLNTPFTTPTDAQYIKFYLSNAYGETYKNDIMLNRGTTALPYSPHFTGLRDAKVTEIKSVGVNIWDEQWRLYGVGANNGVIYPSSSVFSNANFIPVSDSKTYYVYRPTGYTMRFFLYDVNQKYIGYIDTTANKYTFSPLAGSKFLRFQTVSGFSAVYNNDICINVSDTSINGKYYPYTEETIPIPEAVQNLDGWGQGIPGTDCYNFVDWRPEDGVIDWQRRAGAVDLGTANWFLSPGVGFYADIDSRVIATIKGQPCLCALYNTVYGKGELLEKEMSLATTNLSASNGRLFIKDSTYPDAATFKAAMSGVMLIYELATPEVTDISDLLPADNLISVEGNGTVTFENEYDYDMPNTITYMLKEETA